MGVVTGGLGRPRSESCPVESSIAPFWSHDLRRDAARRSLNITHDTSSLAQGKPRKPSRQVIDTCVAFRSREFWVQVMNIRSTSAS